MAPGAPAAAQGKHHANNPDTPDAATLYTYAAHLMSQVKKQQQRVVGYIISGRCQRLPHTMNSAKLQLLPAALQ